MITKEDFLAGNFPTVNTIQEHPVLLFLKKDKKHAFTIKEISKAVGKSKSTCNTAIRKLVKQKKVLHKVPYFLAK